MNPDQPSAVPGLPVALDRALPTGATGHLSDDELYYAERARAANTRRGYRSDLADFAGWCQVQRFQPLPADPATVSGYLIWLARHEAKVSTISRRLSSIAYAHRFAGFANPVDHPRVSVVWEGIRRQHAAGVDQAPPLMPPQLWDVLAALSPGLAGARDRALLLVGFVAALRRSEIAGVCVEHLAAHPKGQVLNIPRSKTDQHGEGQLVVLPYAARPEHCPVLALGDWLAVSNISAGPVFRPVHRNGITIRPNAMAEAAVNRAVQRACARALGTTIAYSAHSLRAGFATYAAQRGASDRAIAHQTRHRSLASLDAYIRVENAWTDNAATILDL